MTVQLETTELKTPSLDGLEQSVHRARLLIDRLRDEKHQLERKIGDLQSRCSELEQEVDGLHNDSTVDELTKLRAAEGEWMIEREKFAVEIDGILEKLDGLEK